jgi:arginine decarboxylase
MVILTNCTFDGHVYNTKRYMEELLAIKPDLVVCAARITRAPAHTATRSQGEPCSKMTFPNPQFLWDEAWFAYAYFNPIMRTRTVCRSCPCPCLCP